MNNELKEQDCSYSGDPMFDQILKDLLCLTNEDNKPSNATNNNNNEQKCNNHNELQIDEMKFIQLKIDNIIFIFFSGFYFVKCV